MHLWLQSEKRTVVKAGNTERDLQERPQSPWTLLGVTWAFTPSASQDYTDFHQYMQRWGPVVQRCYLDVNDPNIGVNIVAVHDQKDVGVWRSSTETKVNQLYPDVH